MPQTTLALVPSLAISQRHLFFGVLCLAWILPGLLAHDPWKPDEAYSFGVVYEMLQGGSWIAPALAGEPFLREPPLYYVSAALSALAFSPPLPLHDAARLATAFYVALALLFCALAGRELNGRGYGALAAVLLIGCFGLVVRSHQLVPQVAGLAGFAMAYYGCARALRGPLGGLWLGTGLGIVFLSQGIPEMLMVLLIAVFLPLVNRAWRTRAYAQAFGLAIAAALPWLIVWPLMLHSHSPGLFRAWVEAETATRVLRGGGFYYIRILPWYAWPVWPLALWSLWRAFGTSPVKPAIALPLTGLIITLLALTESADKRELYAMPLLLPLALLATPGHRQSAPRRLECVVLVQRHGIHGVPVRRVGVLVRPGAWSAARIARASASDSAWLHARIQARALSDRRAFHDRLVRRAVQVQAQPAAAGLGLGKRGDAHLGASGRSFHRLGGCGQVLSRHGGRTAARLAEQLSLHLQP